MTHNLLVVGLDGRVFNFPVDESVDTATLKGWLARRVGSETYFHLTLGGVPLGGTDTIICGQEWGTTLIRAHPVLNGGKGGFGALIRAVGSRANRGYNKDACRDLSGRRLRDVNAQKKVEKWLEDEPERKRKKREEKRKRLLQKKVPPKHFFNDQVYMQQLRANEEDMDGALKQGLVAASSSKRKLPVTDSATGASSSKKPKFWMEGMEEDDDISSSEESAEDSENEYNTCHDQHASGGKTDATLNSAGSSDEAVRSKPSDNEEVEADKHSRENEAEKGPVMIPIPPLDKERDDGTNEGEAEVPVKDNGATNSEEPLHGETKVTDRDEGQLQEKRDVLTNDPLSSQQSFGPLDLDEYSSATELESAGADRLKAVLQLLGLKCGGTLQERARRLFSTKGKSLEELDPSLFAKAGKSRKRKNR